MNNKLALRFSVLAFGLLLIEGIFYLYSVVECQYFSSYYCFDDFGIGQFILVESATILFSVSLGLFILAKFYKGGRLWIRYGIPCVLFVLALIAVFSFVLIFFPALIPRDPYKKELLRQELQRVEQRVQFEHKKIQECDERRLLITQHKDGDPMPIWPVECDKY